MLLTIDRLISLTRLSMEPCECNSPPLFAMEALFSATFSDEGPSLIVKVKKSTKRYTETRRRPCYLSIFTSCDLTLPVGFYRPSLFRWYHLRCFPSLLLQLQHLNSNRWIATLQDTIWCMYFQTKLTKKKEVVVHRVTYILHEWYLIMHCFA